MKKTLVLVLVLALVSPLISFADAQGCGGDLEILRLEVGGRQESVSHTTYSADGEETGEWYCERLPNGFTVVVGNTTAVPRRFSLRVLWKQGHEGKEIGIIRLGPFVALPGEHPIRVLPPEGKEEAWVHIICLDPVIE